jgi:hypothetical protein
LELAYKFRCPQGFDQKKREVKLATESLYPQAEIVVPIGEGNVIIYWYHKYSSLLWRPEAAGRCPSERGTSAASREPSKI